ncbi:MAG TPA: hypothetical protein VGD65_07905 [Chryseosolibacter sp.]
MRTRHHSIPVIILAFVSLASNCLGQGAIIGTASKPGGVSVGITAGHYNYDPAIGLELTSPEVFVTNLRVRGKANVTWLEQYQITDHRWPTFNSYWTGLVYNTNTLERGRVFFESGAYLLQPNKTFSSANLRTGFYGAIGVELFVAPNTRQRFSYFFSGGFAAINARADKLEGRPRYGQGVIFTNGFRYFFLPHKSQIRKGASL